MLIAMGYEKNKPQINADERRFVASNPTQLIGSWDLAPLLFLIFSHMVASGAYRRVGENMVLVLLFFMSGRNPQNKIIRNIFKMSQD